MSLATAREKRVNAGARMAKLIDNEEEDEFYATCYGGFSEVEDDKEFIEREEDHEEDYVDSDFDIDENEEPQNEVEMNEGDEEFKRKRPSRGVFTKAYKEPLVQRKPKVKTEEEEVVEKKISNKTLSETSATSEPETKENKILRNTTAQKRKEREQRQKERDHQNKLKKKKDEAAGETEVREYRRLTQEELLAEAKITEEINLASLDAYQKLELERKKSKQHKYVIEGPVIQYHSVTMPFIDIDEEMYGDQKDAPVETKQSRNFITVTDEETLKTMFDNEKPKVVIPSKCAVTGLPAKYFDPLTNLPYANIFAFKKLREIYEIAKKTAEKNNLELTD